jgi:hypothetical protein
MRPSVERDMKPIVQLFTPIFFVTAGLSLDLRAVDWTSTFIWLFSLSVGFVAIAGKIAGGYLLFQEHWLMRSAIGGSWWMLRRNRATIHRVGNRHPDHKRGLEPVDRPLFRIDLHLCSSQKH